MSDSIDLHFTVCKVPCPEEVMANTMCKYTSYSVSVPKVFFPPELLNVIENHFVGTSDKDVYISNITLLKNNE